MFLFFKIYGHLLAGDELQLMVLEHDDNFINTEKLCSLILSYHCRLHAVLLLPILGNFFEK